jgi:hypothetical protein
MTIKVMKQALDALEATEDLLSSIDVTHLLVYGEVNEAITVLRTAIESTEKQEPVTWKHDCAALLQNDIELWIDRCPHCGKPRMSTLLVAPSLDSILVNPDREMIDIVERLRMCSGDLELEAADEIELLRAQLIDYTLRIQNADLMTSLIYEDNHEFKNKY